MAVQRHRMDVTTNNITNVETTGFKRDAMVTRTFADMLLTRLNDPNILGQLQAIGPLAPGVHVDEINTDFSQGSMEQTGIKTDLALFGDGYFAVQTAQGERYTRTGGFYSTPDGILCTHEGYAVLGQYGPLQVGINEFLIDDNGNLSIDGQVVDRIKTVSFDDDGVLRKVGDNLYSIYGDAQPKMSDAVVKQGYLENSNVDSAREMVAMIEINRTYDTNQRMVRMIDETYGRAVNDIGRV